MARPDDINSRGDDGRKIGEVNYDPDSGHCGENQGKHLLNNVPTRGRGGGTVGGVGGQKQRRLKAENRMDLTVMNNGGSKGSRYRREGGGSRTGLLSAIVFSATSQDKQLTSKRVALPTRISYDGSTKHCHHK